MLWCPNHQYLLSTPKNYYFHNSLLYTITTYITYSDIKVYTFYIFKCLFFMFYFKKYKKMKICLYSKVNKEIYHDISKLKYILKFL